MLAERLISGALLKGTRIGETLYLIYPLKSLSPRSGVTVRSRDGDESDQRERCSCG